MLTRFGRVCALKEYCTFHLVAHLSQMPEDSGGEVLQPVVRQHQFLQGPQPLEGLSLQGCQIVLRGRQPPEPPLGGEGARPPLLNQVGRKVDLKKSKQNCKKPHVKMLDAAHTPITVSSVVRSMVCARQN